MKVWCKRIDYNRVYKTTDEMAKKMNGKERIKKLKEQEIDNNRDKEVNK